MSTYLSRHRSFYANTLSNLAIDALKAPLLPISSSFCQTRGICAVARGSRQRSCLLRKLDHIHSVMRNNPGHCCVFNMQKKVVIERATKIMVVSRS